MPIVLLANLEDRNVLWHVSEVMIDILKDNVNVVIEGVFQLVRGQCEMMVCNAHLRQIGNCLVMLFFRAMSNDVDIPNLAHPMRQGSEELWVLGNCSV